MAVNTLHQHIAEHINRAKQALDRGDVMAAESLLDQLKPAISKVHHQDRVWLYYYVNKAAVLNNKGRFAECLELCTMADRIKTCKADEQVKALVEAARATALLNLARFEESTQHADKAMVTFLRTGNENNAVDVLLTKGKALLMQGYLSEAVGDFSQALYLSKKSGVPKFEARALMELGRVFRQLGYPYLGLDHFREAERKFCNSGAAHEQAAAIYEKAATLIATDSLQLARSAISKIESIKPKHPFMDGFLYRLHHKMALQTKKYDAAFEYAKRFRDFCVASGDQKGNAEGLTRMGQTCCYLNNYVDAERYLKQALSIAKQINDIENQGLAEHWLNKNAYRSGSAKPQIPQQTSTIECANIGLGLVKHRWRREL